MRAIRALLALAAAVAVMFATWSPASAHHAKPTATFVGCNYEGTDYATAVIVVRDVTKPVRWSASFYNADGTSSRVHGRVVHTDRRVFRFRFDLAAEQLLQVRMKRGDRVLMNERMDDMEHCGTSYSQS